MSGARIYRHGQSSGVVAFAPIARAARGLDPDRGLRRDFEWRSEAIDERFDAIATRLGTVERAPAGLEGLREAATGRRPAAWTCSGPGACRLPRANESDLVRRGSGSLTGYGPG